MGIVSSQKIPKRPLYAILENSEHRVLEEAPSPAVAECAANNRKAKKKGGGGVVTCPHSDLKDASSILAASVLFLFFCFPRGVSKNRSH